MNQVETNKRVEWIDVIKYICIILVMYCHSSFNQDAAYTFYKHFFLNAFFFVSGYVYKNKDEFKTFLVKKTKGLLVPWFWFSVLNIFLSQIMTFNEKEDLRSAILKMLLQVRGYDDRMWFLAALFVAFIPFYFIVRFFESTNKNLANIHSLVVVVFILSLLSKVYARYMNPELLPWKLVGLPWHIEYIFIIVFWMIIGYLFRNYWECQFDDQRMYFFKICSLPLAIILSYILDLSNIKFNIPVEICLSYVAEILCMTMLIFISKQIKANIYISYIGSNTLICFGLHGKITAVIEKIIQVLNPTIFNAIINNIGVSIVIGIIFAIMLSVILIVPIYVIRKWFPFIIGKGYK